MRAWMLLIFPLTACSTGWDGTGKDPNAEDDDSGYDTSIGTDTDTGGGDTDTDTGGGDTDTGTPPEDRDGDLVAADEDCDDGDATVYPGAAELCDGKDNNCDGSVDDEGDFDTDGILDCEDYCPVYVAPLATGDGRYGHPLGYVQDAVDLAASSGCYEVRAYQGVYYENVDWRGEPVNAESVAGPEYTTIDGGATATVVTFTSGETEEARLYGFTITNGGGASGAGINIKDGAPTIEGNIITLNDAADSTFLGGGIRSYNSDPIIVDNEITYNNAGLGGPEDGSDGGGINVRGGAPWIEGNFIAYNTAGDGGGIWLAYSDAMIVNNWIVGNEADDEATTLDPDKGGQGGGIDVQIGGATDLMITNNIITDNLASIIGGGIAVYEYNSGYPNTQIEFNVVAFNTVTETDRGAGIAQWRYTVPTLSSNIVYANNGTGVYSETGVASFVYNDVYGNDEDYGGDADVSGTGNLSVDPKFTSASPDGDPENDDWSLKAGSGCINTGEEGVFDADLSRADMGAFGGPAGGW